MDVLSCLLDNKVVGLRILTSKDPGLVRRILKDYILKDQTGKSGKVSLGHLIFGPDRPGWPPSAD